MKWLQSLPNSSALFYGGIAGIIAAAALAACILIYYHVRKGKLDAVFDKEYGKDLYSDHRKKHHRDG